MKIQRHFAPTGGRFQSESVARFIGICIGSVEPEIFSFLVPTIN
ncbi:MAG: hypothetical protein AB1410_04290 [Acidobacteriota bacterium]